MFGAIDLFQVAVCFIAGVSIFTDLTQRKIFNWLTFPSMLIGIIFSMSSHGLLQGVLFSGSGILMGFALYSGIYALGGMGAGDVKLIMAFGAWLGWHTTVEAGLLAILLGGGIAILFLAFRGRLSSFISKMFLFFLPFFIKDLEIHAFRVDQSLKMPFGVSIGLAAIWCVYLHPLARLGILY